MGGKWPYTYNEFQLLCLTQSQLRWANTHTGRVCKLRKTSEWHFTQEGSKKHMPVRGGLKMKWDSNALIIKPTTLVITLDPTLAMFYWVQWENIASSFKIQSLFMFCSTHRDSSVHCDTVNTGVFRFTVKGCKCTVMQFTVQRTLTLSHDHPFYMLNSNLLELLFIKQLFLLCKGHLNMVITWFIKHLHVINVSYNFRISCLKKVL